MRGILSMILVLSLLLISSIVFSQERIDLNGTWKGETYVEGGPDIYLMLTLVLEQKDNKIAGRLNDDMGYIDSEITEGELESNVFTFKAVAQSPEGDITTSFKVTVTGDIMEGEWDTEEGYYGSWTATREKVDSKP